MQADGALAPPPRHNDVSDRPPHVHSNRGRSERVGHHCVHSLCTLGEPLSIRAELGSIHYAFERVSVDEELTLLIDSLSAIHLLFRWRRNRTLTP